MGCAWKDMGLDLLDKGTGDESNWKGGRPGDSQERYL